LNTGNGSFSEISNMAGVANTDWSWSSLFADFDLDGYNDMYISNGIYRDVLDKDANKKIQNRARSKGRKPTEKDFFEYTQMLPQQKKENYFFKNKGNLMFEDVTRNWGTKIASFSNGASYADLDNDGDLDLVINNINETATLLKNNAIELQKGSFLQFEFSGPEKNNFGVGVHVKLVFEDGSIQTRQLINSRGYLSTVSNKLHFGIAESMKLVKVVIHWPDKKSQEIYNIELNQLTHVKYEDAKKEENIKTVRTNEQLFKEVVFDYKHKDTIFNDYQIQLLLPHKLSQLGPAIAKGDINKDGIDDLFLGGACLQEGMILVGMPSGKFKKTQIQDIALDNRYEDIAALFFDADNDGDDDLYVVSGSYEFYIGSKHLQDRLYINDGKGGFDKCESCLPKFNSAGSVVTSSDFDNDGDLDLFIGGRLIPGRYPYAPKSYLLMNNKGVFSIETKVIAPELERIGMVTDAVWNDIDDDADLDLIVTGEWMGIEVFENKLGVLKKSNQYKELSNAKGWWNKIYIADIDKDGRKDIVAGNLGLNSKLQASKEKPLRIYTKDFDENGTEDIFLVKDYKGKQVPIRGKSCTAEQMPYLQDKIKTYNDFANRDLTEIIGNKIESALYMEVREFKSGVFYNKGNRVFSFQPFSNEVQKSPINSILYKDFDADGIRDLLLAGNNYMSEIETTRADAGVGSLLKGRDDGLFEYIPNRIHGFYADRDVRNMSLFNGVFGEYLIVINNNNTHQVYTLDK